MLYIVTPRYTQVTKMTFADSFQQWNNRLYASLCPVGFIFGVHFWGLVLGLTFRFYFWGLILGFTFEENIKSKTQK